MKPSSKLTYSVTLLYLCQTMLMPFEVRAEYQSSPGSAGGAPISSLPGAFGIAPNPPDFNTIATSMSQDVQQCMIAAAFGVAGDPQATMNNAIGNVERWKSVLSKDQSTKTGAKGNYCNTDCSSLMSDIQSEPECTDFADGQVEEITITSGDTKKTVSGRPGKSGWKDTAKSAREKISAAKACYMEKADDLKCPNPEKKALEQQLRHYECQMQAMQKAVQKASEALQTSINKSTEQFETMNNFQTELKAQNDKVLEELGGDPTLGSSSAASSGLLAIQKQMNESLPKMMEMETTLTEAIQKHKDDTKSLQQEVETSRVNRANACLTQPRTGSEYSGYSLTCQLPAPVLDADGKPSGRTQLMNRPCSAVEYVTGMIQSRALMSANGKRLQTTSRVSKGFANSTGPEMTKLVNDIQASLTGNGSGVTDVQTWEALQAKIGPQLAMIDSKFGTNTQSVFQNAGTRCFADAQGWKAKYVESKDYRDKQTTLKSGLKKITDELSSGLTAMNKAYGEAAFALIGQHATLNRAECGNSNPDTMMSCFSKFREGMKNVLEGGPTSFEFKKPFPGGVLTKPLLIKCRGIDGCVRELTNAHKAQKTSMEQSQKLQAAIVNVYNTKTREKMTGFASILSNLQNNLVSSFGNIKAKFQKMGIDSPEAPNFLAGEQLQQSKGPPPNNAPGPFEMPKNMSQAISGMMTPNGMVDFADTGMRDPMKQLAQKDTERKESLKEKQKDAEKLLLLYSDSKIESSCSIAGTSGSSKSTASSDNVGAMQESCSECTFNVNQCEVALSSSSTTNAGLKEALDAIEDLSTSMEAGVDIEKSKYNQFQSNLNALAGAPAGCDKVRDQCKICKTDGKKVYTSEPGSQDVTIKAN